MEQDGLRVHCVIRKVVALYSTFSGQLGEEESEVCDGVKHDYLGELSRLPRQDF